MVNKKAQAAMEFLMTYGWAILVVLAAIGALAYFGVLSPEKFMPEKCTISPGIDCQGFNIETDNAEFSLRNGMGKSLLLQEITVGNCTKTFSPEEEFNNGELLLIQIDGCSFGTVNSRFRSDVLIRYTEAESGIEKLTNGNVVAKILE